MTLLTRMGIGTQHAAQLVITAGQNIGRLRYDPRTIDYMNRRRAEGLSKRDVLRCLKRFIAREIFKDMKLDLHPN